MSKLGNFLSRVGEGLFKAISTLQERGTLPGFTAWLKLTVLGVLVAVISVFAKKETEPMVTCYKPAPVWPAINEIAAVPNPTRGADTVAVAVEASVFNGSVYGRYISNIQYALGADTVDMIPSDGSFGDTLETAEARLPVSALDSDTNRIVVIVSDSNGWVIQDSVDVIVTAQDSQTDETTEE